MSVYNLKDEELFNLIKEDDKAAFTILYKRYWKVLLYKALSKTHSHHDAEELVQDSLFQIWKYRKTIMLEYTFSTYIGSILAYNTIKKLASKKKNVGNPTENILELHIEDNSTQNTLDYLETVRQLETSISALPEKCQLVFKMSRIEGKSHKEISEELNITHDTVRHHIKRALKVIQLNVLKFYTLIIQSYSQNSFLRIS
jgi:RNA polymerase sigma-70 factor (family 1)